MSLNSTRIGKRLRIPTTVSRFSAVNVTLSATIKKTLEGHTDGVKELSVTSDGQRAVSAFRDGTVRVWDLHKGRLLHTLEGHTGWVWGVSMTPDGQRAVSASEDGTVRVWDLHRGESMACFTAEVPLSDCAIAPDHVTMIVGAQTGQVHILRLEEM
jgi:WD40 repeat protein